MRMLKSVIECLLLASLAILASPGQVAACDCVRLDAPTPVYSGVIVRGRVIRLAMDTSTYTLAVELEVLEVLSGVYGEKTITGYVHPFGVSCHGYDFRPDREYIVFPVRNRETTPSPGGVVAPALAFLFGGLCGPTEDLQTVRGQQKLREIREYFKGK